jgi:large subunit ribosomal protein L23
MQVLKRPIVTEKANELQKTGVYTFEVARDANKFQIKEAVEKLYGVQVADVNTMIKPGKPKNRYTRGGVVSGQTRPIKKALVTLVAGELIDLYDNAI